MPIREIISSYDQPIVMGLTPYTRSTLKLHELRSDWPPTRDEERLTAYSLYTALIENRPSDVFDDLRGREDQSDKISLALALPELVTSVWADAVWSDPPTIELQASGAEDRWQAIDTANDFSEIGGWESVFGAAGWGTSVLRLRRDETRTARWDTDVVIEEIDPAIYFPVLKRGSARDVESIVLAWSEDRSDPDAEKADIWQVREVHDVVNGQYQIERFERREGGPFSRDSWRSVKFEQPAGVDFLPFVDLHAKRWRSRYWGVSELARNVTLFDEMDNTLSNIAEILEYHGKPMLQVPASVIYGGTLTKGADRAMGIRRPEDKDIARYITYDGQIDAQLADLDRLLELALLVSEVPRTYFGVGVAAQSAPSGTSLKLQLQNYLKKADRYQRAESKRLRELVPMALALDGKVAKGRLLDMMPKITHGSPLPADDEQEARIEQGLFGAGMSSLELSLRKLRRVPADEIDDEIARIEDEKAASVAALPAAFGQNAGADPNADPTKPNSSTDPNADQRGAPPAA